MITKASGLFKLLVLDGTTLRFLDFGQPDFKVTQVRRSLHPLNAESASGFIDEVDGLIGQEAIGDVPVGEVGRGHEGLIGDRDPVMSLILIPDALEDFDGVSQGGFIHFDGLEAALESGVFLHVLAVLVQGCGTHGLQFPTGQHRLEDRGCIDGTFGGAGAHQSMDLIDEQHDVATGLDLFEDLLEALLKVTAVTGTSHQ